MSTSRATTWVIICTGIAVAIPLLFYWISHGKIIHDDIADVLRISDEIGWAMYIISGIVGVVLTAFFFPLVVNIINWLAQKLGGFGNNNQLGLLLGAIWSPSRIIESVIEGIFPPIIGLALRYLFFLYEAFLLIICLRTANRLTWWRAIAVVVIIGIFILLIGVAYVGCMRLVSLNG